MLGSGPAGPFALDLPLAAERDEGAADAFGGVIITDWYAPPETPQERFKLNVYILGKELRAEAVRVTVFHQKETNGQWQDVAAEPQTGNELEDTILARAEKLRSQALGTGGS